MNELFTKEELENLYLVEKLSARKIGQLTRCDKNTVTNYLKNFGIPIRSNKAAIESVTATFEISGFLTKSELSHLYIEERLSTIQIGEIKNCLPSTVLYYLNKHGIPIRDLKEAAEVASLNFSQNGQSLEELFSKKELHQLYITEELSTVRIAEIKNCSSGTVTKYLKKYGIPIRNRKEASNMASGHVPKKLLFSKDELNEKYIVKQLSTYDISREKNCTVSTVTRYLNKYEIPIRDSKEATRIAREKNPIKPLITKEELERLYIDKKLSTTEIAKRKKCAGSTVAKYLSNYDIPIRTYAEAASISTRTGSGKTKSLDIPKKTLDQLYTIDGLSTFEVGEILGCTGQTVRKYLDLYKIPKRKRTVKNKGALDMESKKKDNSIEKNGSSEKFRERLKALRLEFEMVQQDVADLSGLTKSTISRFESGKKTPSRESVEKLSAIFKVSSDYLLGISDSKYSNISGLLAIKEDLIGLALRIEQLDPINREYIVNLIQNELTGIKNK
ncbi:helix-turn-helix domain-containing protein [Bacillus cereus]|uniref:helix-turn-helix domain-containing protein n=1 Tax=Bacillus cereus TaxID=1396 RepID=UPI0020CD3F60|nr:helix-turn-helix transcriptional regulator [Bacillus cereus]